MRCACSTIGNWRAASARGSGLSSVLGSRPGMAADAAGGGTGAWLLAGPPLAHSVAATTSKEIRMRTRVSRARRSHADL